MKRFITLLSLGILGTLAGSALPAEPDGAKTHLLRSERKPGAIDHVVFSWEIGGDLKESRKADAKPDSVAMSGVCDAEYDERTLEVPGETAGCWRSVRWYGKAAAVNKRADEVMKLSLRPERFLVVTQVAPPAVTLFSPRGPLTRDELEVTDVVGNSLVLDALLPEKRAAEGDTWKLPSEITAALLGLQSVSRGAVESTLKEVTETVARFELAGRVEGAYNDITPSLEVKAKYRYDRRTKRIDWFGLLIKMQQAPGEVDAGMDAVVRVQLRITPKENCEALNDAALKGLVLRPDPESTLLSYESVQGGWQLTHDRRWHLHVDSKNLAVLKLIDRQEPVARCHVSSLPKRPPDKLPSLEEFQEDVRRGLGKNFGEFVEARESTDEAEHRVFRVVVRGEGDVASPGKPEKEPIQWNYYLVADRLGRQAVLAFPIREKLVERLDKADEELVRSIRFTEAKPASDGKQQATQKKAADPR